MTIYVADIIAVLFVLIYMVLGFKRGAVYEMLRLIIVAMCFMAAYLVYPYLLEFLSKFLNKSFELSRLSFVAPFVVFVVVSTPLTERLVTTLGTLKNPGRLIGVFGTIFAGVRGLIYLGSILWLITSFADDTTVGQQVNSGIITKNTRTSFGKVFTLVDKNIRKNHFNSFMIKEKIDI